MITAQDMENEKAYSALKWLMARKSFDGGGKMTNSAYQSYLVEGFAGTRELVESVWNDLEFQDYEQNTEICQACLHKVDPLVDEGYAGGTSQCPIHGRRSA